MKEHIKKVRLLFRKVIERVKNILVDTKKPCRQTTNQGQGYSVSQGHTTKASISSNVSQNQLYEASDVAKGYVCAHEKLLDFIAMLTAIDNEHEKIIELVQKFHDMPEPVFMNLKRLIEITGRMLDQSLELVQDQKNIYNSQC